MDINYRYTMLEYKELTAGIIGDLVRMDVKYIREENLGVGVVLKHRRYHGEIHLKIAWLCSPHIRFKSERTVGWHNYERIRFISSIGERKECL